MSYQEKNTAVTLITMILLFAFYVMNVLQMVQNDDLNAIAVFSLWLTLIVIGIVTTIVGSIITQVAFSIIHMVRTNEDESFFTDERDNIIELKGMRSSYYGLSLGVLIAIISLILGAQPVAIFALLTGVAFISNIIGDISRLYLYRRGF